MQNSARRVSQHRAVESVTARRSEKSNFQSPFKKARDSESHSAEDGKDLPQNILLLKIAQNGGFFHKERFRELNILKEDLE